GESALDQAMGLMNHDGETNIALLVDKTIATLVDKLKDIRLILSSQEEVCERHFLEPEVLLFPDELSRLHSGLLGFCNGAFKDNPFQELPPLRGIYFCSGEQSGRTALSITDTTSRLGSRELPGTGHGLFLHDFFAKILPADRALYAPTRRARDWQRLTGNLWLTGFATAVLLLCILLTHAWHANKTAINTVAPEYKQTILFKNDPVADTAMMVEFGAQIKRIMQINREWSGPRMGLNASIRLETALKQRYCRRFHEHFDADINNRIEGVIAKGGWHKDNADPAVRYIPFIVRRINLLRARFDGADAAGLAAMPDPDYALMLFGKERSQTADEVFSHYKNAYIDYLIWQTDVEPLNRSLAGMQRLLSNFFAENHGDMRWLVTWADRHLHDRVVRMNTFWHGTQPDSEMATVGPAFSRQGQQLIGRFVTEELETAVGQSLMIAQPKAQFAAWYQDAYYTAWFDFCAQFNQGPKLFAEDADWEAALEHLTGDETPYTVLLERLEGELFPPLETQTQTQAQAWPSLKPTPETQEKYGLWLTRVRNFGIARHADVGALGDQPAARQILDQAGNQMSGKTAFAAKIALGAMEQSRLAKAGEALRQYRQAIAAFSGITTDSRYAYKIVRQSFEATPTEGASPLHTANRALEELAAALAPAGPPVDISGDRDPLSRLLKSPLDHLWQFSVAQSGCYLQELWDQEVVVKVQGVRSSRKRATLLFGNEGLVQGYMRTHAGPFVRQSSSRGYYPLELQDAHVPFEKNFFKYVQQGRRWWVASGGAIQESYAVSITALPTDVNAEAHLKPYMTRLILEHPDGDTVLENKQYPVERVFTWLPMNDGDVVLQILFENLALSRRYSGYCAFGQFLRDFSKGSKRFKAKHFPEQLSDLRRIRVDEIEVNYRMTESQAKPIKRLLRAIPQRPPGTIVQCAKPAR
ncbi:MAG: hypothetical protein HKP58_09015, partial [Desulfatitalea sp.]|nr:hypothetical protein [Desulfatitalea sp.]NNK00540.1 hypothetical protein [Desulfatitalea sp.]